MTQKPKVTRRRKCSPELRNPSDIFLEAVPTHRIPQNRIPECVTSEITLRIGPIVFTVVSRTPTMSQIVHTHFSHLIDNPEESSVRLVCDSGYASEMDSLIPLVKTTIEPRSNYWVLRSNGFEATYFPRYRLAWVGMPERLPHLLKLLQMLVTLWLDDVEGVLIQGTTIVHQERSYLLLEESSSPEESRPGIPRRPLLLGEEVSLVARSQSGEFMAYQTPFGNHSVGDQKPMGAPLGSVFIFSDVADRQRASITPKQFHSSLLNKVLMYTADSPTLATLKNRVWQIVDGVRIHMLPRRGEMRFWDIVEKSCPTPNRTEE